MNVTDELTEELEIQSSGGEATLENRGNRAGGTLLALALAGTCYSATGVNTEHLLPTPIEQYETNSSGVSGSFETSLTSERDVVTALEEVMRDLSSEQVELDEDAKRVLYENRWDLYE